MTYRAHSRVSTGSSMSECGSPSQASRKRPEARANGQDSARWHQGKPGGRLRPGEDDSDHSPEAPSEAMWQIEQVSPQKVVFKGGSFFDVPIENSRQAAAERRGRVGMLSQAATQLAHSPYPRRQPRAGSAPAGTGCPTWLSGSECTPPSSPSAMSSRGGSPAGKSSLAFHVDMRRKHRLDDFRISRGPRHQHSESAPLSPSLTRLRQYPGTIDDEENRDETAEAYDGTYTSVSPSRSLEKRGSSRRYKGTPHSSERYVISLPGRSGSAPADNGRVTREAAPEHRLAEHDTGNLFPQQRAFLHGVEDKETLLSPRTSCSGDADSTTTGGFCSATPVSAFGSHESHLRSRFGIGGCLPSNSSAPDLSCPTVAMHPQQRWDQPVDIPMRFQAPLQPHDADLVQGTRDEQAIYEQGGSDMAIHDVYSPRAHLVLSPGAQRKRFALSGDGVKQAFPSDHESGYGTASRHGSPDSQHFTARRVSGSYKQMGLRGANAREALCPPVKQEYSSRYRESYAARAAADRRLKPVASEVGVSSLACSQSAGLVSSPEAARLSAATHFSRSSTLNAATHFESHPISAEAARLLQPLQNDKPRRAKAMAFPPDGAAGVTSSGAQHEGVVRDDTPRRRLLVSPSSGCAGVPTSVRGQRFEGTSRRVCGAALIETGSDLLPGGRGSSPPSPYEFPYSQVEFSASGLASPAENSPIEQQVVRSASLPASPVTKQVFDFSAGRNQFIPRGFEAGQPSAGIQHNQFPRCQQGFHHIIEDGRRTPPSRSNTPRDHDDLLTWAEPRQSRSPSCHRSASKSSHGSHSRPVSGNASPRSVHDDLVCGGSTPAMPSGTPRQKYRETANRFFQLHRRDYSNEMPAAGDYPKHLDRGLQCFSGETGRWTQAQDDALGSGVPCLTPESHRSSEQEQPAFDRKGRSTPQSLTEVENSQRLALKRQPEFRFDSSVIARSVSAPPPRPARNVLSHEAVRLEDMKAHRRGRYDRRGQGEEMHYSADMRGFAHSARGNMAGLSSHAIDSHGPRTIIFGVDECGRAHGPGESADTSRQRRQQHFRGGEVGALIQNAGYYHALAEMLERKVADAQYAERFRAAAETKREKAQMVHDVKQKVHPSFTDVAASMHWSSHK